ncbi:A24 family peptidase [Rhodospira trueperi]|uniref:Prepilin peptidase CpaA n=1 Tax=Rhodospira trueperi TaxID=69960 RepID=A0A1G7DZS1_9PROT|nr:prepilin peptidase [Rhodospira trueperi]SDE56676.1 prepilin peptidase CpaA [Rhodospira trueperi]
MEGDSALAAIVVMVLCCAASVEDVLAFRIADRYSIFIAGLFLLVAAVGVLGGGVSIWTVLLTVGWSGLIFIVATTLFAFGMFGGGDVKLLTAVSLWVVPGALLHFILYVALAGGVVSLLVLLLRLLVPFATKKQWFVPTFFTKFAEANRDVPYGLAIAAGTVVVWMRGALGITGVAPL